MVYGMSFYAPGRTDCRSRVLELTLVQKQEQQKADNATAGPKKKKVTAAQLRVQKGKLAVRLDADHLFSDLSRSL